MRRPNRKRSCPREKRFGQPPAGVDLDAVARQANYIGSQEHKSTPMPGQIFVGPRPNASLCDPAFSPTKPSWATLRLWLETGIMNGQFQATWDRGFPKYVWHKQGDQAFLAIHSGNGEYHGFPITKDEWPEDWL
ncbi:MAG: hypothetical protein ACKVY0_26045 [Prosthecobacter sp.]|uniref:hypothetical protein n=1 Tax=Prosthecobacter sp. TaxID=1965333 RepID=UPI003900CFFD